MDYAALFAALHPGFFDQPHIRALPPEEVYEEQMLDLRTFPPDALTLRCPEHITFGLYTGDPSPLHDAVRLVDEDWVQYFDGTAPVYCAFDGDEIVSFCIVDDMGTHAGLRIGGPGCVGTVPAYRRLGIGLMMVSKATELLRRQSFDCAYIHYTHVGRWYARLGYQTILRWNSRGLLP
ncbi:MAG: GNAT family N-acetyltransferase [Clostridia bacterium]|nr:GNAT family N-acetyltransferase [Clostridia bacterium]